MRLVLFGLAAAALAARPAAAQTCGNAVREPLEQCDDGNNRNLDGCDASCRFEQVHRISRLQLQEVTAPGCPANAFAAALWPVALFQSQVWIDASVATGATSILLHFLGLDDLTGTDDAALEVGVGSGAPVQPGSVPYNANPDWWYAADTTLLDGQRQPLHRLPATLAGSQLNAGPGGAFLNLVLPNQSVSLWTSSLTIDVATGASSTPAGSTGLPPGHLTLEHLDPALESFASAGVPDQAWGNLCGNVSAQSLAQTLAPPAMQVGALTACTQHYTAANSMLDVLVSGCDVLGYPLVEPTQPDASDPNAPPVGAGPPYTLLVNEATRKVSGCSDGSGALVDLSGCLRDAAHSVHFAFTSDRVITGDDRIHRDGFESGGLTLWSAASTDDGDLGVSPTAAMAGSTQGLLGVIDDTTGLFVEDTKPEDENRYRARFYFDPTGFDPGEAAGARRTRIFVAFEDDPSRRLATVVLKRRDGAYSLMGRVRLDDDSQRDTGFFPIVAGPHVVEIDWMRSSGPDASDGRFVLFIDGVVVSTLSGVDNSISSVDYVRLGALSIKAGANGVLKWDHFESRRMSGIGP